MAKSFMRSSTISIWILISIFTGKTFQSGFFELQILEVTNVNSRIANGRCCGNSSVAVESETANSLYKLSSSGSSNYVNCPRCSTAFRLCLKEFQKSASSRASDWQGCAYGNASTQILGASSFRLADHPTNIGGMKLNFTFRWTESFTLILQALDIVSSTSSALIEEASYSGIKLPSRDWDTLEHVGKIAQFTYRFRVTCDNNYYSNTCNEFCRKRDDAFGHYDCAHNGTKLCHPGWNGDNCDRAICKPGCHPDHGSCIRPGECECRSNSGWRGPLCNECMPYPGCRHGTCKDAPWQCICDRNWGGILCDQDLNYCGTHEPCLHGGTCENTAPDKYRCTCAEGLSGDRCEIVEEPCAPQPCKNGGTCRSHDMQKYKKPINATVNYRSVQGGSVIGKPGRSLDRNPAVRLIQNEPPKTKEVINNYTCICANGYAGPNCEIDIDECASRPCANEGTCVDLVGGFRCECPIEWTGEFCHLDVNECESNSASTFGPCINADECQNLDGGFRCICQVGWSGETCTKNIDDCIGSCQNGATCIDLVNDFHCSCPEGFSGKNCSLNVNECLDTPCKNGGECIDLHGSYECRCPVGYFGTNCEEITNHCEPSPCNGGKCINTPGSFYCQCPVGRTGARCELFHTFCGSQSCNGVDICKTSPCKNGGTCTKVDNGFACQCTYGWSGPNCTERVIGCQSKDCQTDCLYSSNPSACALSSNLCEPNPCHNGGTCEFGEGWFRCLCAKGFDGSVCRVNVNECASSPCHGGGTCRDEIGDFTCICPPGRRGNQCEIVLSDGNEEHVCSNTSTARASDNRCNFCVCSNGIPRCSDLWCGLENCFSPNGTTCGSREVCVPQSKETCLGHPCTPRGDCRELEPLKRVAPPMYPADTNCWPNQIKLNEKCARISVTLQTTSLPAGTSVEDVCHTMRVFLGVYTAQKAFTHTSTQTVLLCENKETFNDVIEVAIFSQAGRAAQVADVLGEIMSRRPATIEMLALTDTFELSVLRSILEVRVETALLSEGAAEKGFQFFLISAICLTIVSVIMFALLLFRRRAYPHLDSGSHLPSDLSRCHEEEKSNNLQNEENFRRYANPLKGSSSSLKGAVELSSAPDPTLQPRAGPSGLNRSQPYLATCDMEYEIDSGGDLKGGGKRASQLLLQKTPNTDLSRNTMMETKDFDKMNKMNKQSPNAAISDSNLLTVHV